MGKETADREWVESLELQRCEFGVERRMKIRGLVLEVLRFGLECGFGVDVVLRGGLVGLFSVLHGKNQI